jgi:alginate O-acetyltransferase complex protein AlgI
MWLIAATVFATAKVLTWRPVAPRLALLASAGYLCAWPGLDPAPFLVRVRGASFPRLVGWVSGLACTALGLWLAGPARAGLGADDLVVSGALGMAAIVLMLHFGLFRLLAALWRLAGYDVRPIMNAPLMATSLVEFWSRRWNLAFRDLSRQLVLRPLAPRIGAAGAMWCVFLFSGVVHDLVITVPAGGGYGGPTVYFLVQATGVALQRSGVARRRRLDVGWRGWLVTAVFVVGPVGLLFPSEFLTRVIVPFLDALSA